MRRPLLWLLAGLALATITIADFTSATVVLVGGIALLLMVRFRGRRVIRIAAVTITGGLTVVGLVAALAVPRYAAAQDPLIVAGDPPQTPLQRTGAFELSGYVVSDNDNATASVDLEAPHLSTVVPTGGLVNADGTFLYTGVQNALIHAHLAGARGELLVQNCDPNLAGGEGDFSPALATAVLRSESTREAFARSVSDVVASEHWDGVVVDFEMLPAEDRAPFVDLLRRLDTRLPAHSRLAVSIPVIDAVNLTTGPYDLAGISTAVDVVNLMTYDQHDPSGDAGPIASLPWVRQAITTALTQVPASRLQIGIADYAYAWGPSTSKLGASMSVQAAQAAAASGHVTPRWDPVSAEWTAQLPDHTILWWSDARSMTAVATLALSMHLEGASVWELSNGASLASVAAHLPIERSQVSVQTQRGVERVNAKGLVALTFDDGPDPAWTPSILRILRDRGVPGTFFDVGMNAQAHPDLVSQEVASGGVIGNHTYSHLDLTEIPRWRAQMEIAAGSWVIRGITGRTPLLFRSPYGAAELADSNSSSHKDLAAALGMWPVGWNVDPYDWQQPGAKAIVERVLAAKGTNLIVLLHDGGGDRSQTVAALPLIIDQLKSRGYDFVTADQIDGSVAGAYAASPTAPLDIAKTLLSIAAFRLWGSAHTVVVWAMILLGVLSLIRIILSWPLAFVQWRRMRREPPFPPISRHSVTVLIPAHNEQATLAKSLRALSKVHGPIVQIIVAENGSSDATMDVARELAAELSHLPIEVRDCGAGGKAHALNSSLPLCRGDIVVVLDADTVLDPDFILRVLPHFHRSSVGAVAGNVKVGNRQRLLPQLQALEYVMSLGLDRRAQALLNVVSVIPGAAGAFRRDALVRVQGWPERTLTEDTDLTVSLLTAGWEIPYESRAVSWTEAPESVSDVLKQRRRWAYGAAQVSAVHGRRMLDSREGRVGLLALPWLFVAQVLLPAAGPIVDAYLLWLVLNGDWRPAVGMLVLAVSADVALAAWALVTDHEPLHQLWLVPLSRFVWRPLMLVAVTGSLTSWLMGRSVQWRQLRRRNTVLVPTRHPVS